MTKPSLTQAVRRTAATAAHHPKKTVLAWILLVVALAVGGGLAGTRTAGDADSGAGQSGHADRQLRAAGLRDHSVEDVLVSAADPGAAARAADTLRARLARLPAVASVAAPQRARTGGARLLAVTLHADPSDADDGARAIMRVVDAARAPGVRFQQAGPGTGDVAIDAVVSTDLGHSEVLSLPVTLLILLVAFGAFLAASIPLVLGLTAVMAAIGAMGLSSHLEPVDDTAFSLIVLVGLAVGVDYSLFAIRRLREERAAGHPVADALDLTAATVGRAIVVSGATVVVALAGLLTTGLPVFASVAAGTILVVGLAVLGSLTVLPALLTLFGDRVARAPRWRRAVRARGWARLARAVTLRPAPWLVLAVGTLGGLAAVATQLHTTGDGNTQLPRDLPIVKAQDAIAAEFPSAPDPATLVVRGADLGAHGAQLSALGSAAARAAAPASAAGFAPLVRLSRDARTAAIAVPLGPDPDAAIGRIRADVVPVAARAIPGARAALTGEDARAHDLTHRLQRTTPLVVGGVLLLAFALLVVSFGSPWLAAGVVGLNLLSVLAAYGIMVGVFQHTWAQGVLDFHSAGAITDWLPLLAFVILFGISMDYTVLVLERVREARLRGLCARDAAAEGLARTAGAVTSAAVVMVAVFAILGSQRLLSMKEMGVGLAAAVLLDATIVRAVALPALLSLLGEDRWQVWQHRGDGPLATEGRRAA